MSETNVENLNQLLQKFIGAGNVVKETKVSRLTKPGDNYGSIMLKVEAKILGSNNEEETLHVVAKCIPEDEFYRRLFQVDTSVMAEMKFYTDIVPLVQEFQREHGVMDVINCFPKFYGGRMNLKEQGDQIDDHAVLILENLIVSGFRNIDRYTGFNLEEANLVLKDLSTFHAACLALRLKKPQLFEERIRKYCATRDEHTGPPVGTLLTDMLEDYDSVKPYIGKLKGLVAEFVRNRGASHATPGDLFATVAHKDLWVNNTMQRFEDGKVVENKFVDFQGYMYDSAVRDLCFFLVTSCRFEVLKDNIDELVKHYLRHFVRTLSKLDCDTSVYTLEALYQEMKTFAQEDIALIMFFTTFVVFGRDIDDTGRAATFQLTKDQVPDEVKNRIVFLIDYYAKHDWL